MSPYKVTKVKKGKGKSASVCFSVSGPSGVHAKCTTRKKAFGQVAIMERHTKE
jgi:hypothetical protein